MINLLGRRMTLPTIIRGEVLVDMCTGFGWSVWGRGTPHQGNIIMIIMIMILLENLGLCRTIAQVMLIPGTHCSH